MTGPLRRVFSYVVTSDTGFSPNPFGDVCTLACCKPMIRRAARVGDVIVGMTSRCERIVYAMQVAESISFEDYWHRPEFAKRRPIMDSASAVERRGDNIYETKPDGGFRQLASRHSHRDGTENQTTKFVDLNGDQVLVAHDYVYWGDDGPHLPDDLRFLEVGRGHRCHFTAEQLHVVAHWFESAPRGVQGCPARWPLDDESWRTA